MMGLVILCLSPFLLNIYIHVSLVEYLTLSALQTNTDTFANSADPDGMI